MFGLGSQELFFILLIVILIYGGPRLPQIGKGIGEAIRNFKKAFNDPPEVDVTPKKDGEEKKEVKEEKK